MHAPEQLKMDDRKQTRRGRPEWAVRVVTVTGKTLVKLSDGRIFEPDSEKNGE